MDVSIIAKENNLHVIFILMLAIQCKNGYRLTSYGGNAVSEIRVRRLTNYFNVYLNSTYHEYSLKKSSDKLTLIHDMIFTCIYYCLVV